MVVTGGFEPPDVGSIPTDAANMIIIKTTNAKKVRKILEQIAIILESGGHWYHVDEDCEIYI